MDFDRIIPLYMSDCNSRQLRIKTMQAYEQALRMFSVWLQERYGINDVEVIKDLHIRDYINDLQTRGKYTFCADRRSENVNHPQNRRDYQKKISNITINNYLRKEGYVLGKSKPLSHSTHQRLCDRVFKILGIKGRFTSYDFRSTYGTELCEAGLTSKQVGDLMGHADSRMVETVYARRRESGVMQQLDLLNNLNSAYAN